MGVYYQLSLPEIPPKWEGGGGGRERNKTMTNTCNCCNGQQSQTLWLGSLIKIPLVCQHNIIEATQTPLLDLVCVVCCACVSFTKPPLPPPKKNFCPEIILDMKGKGKGWEKKRRKEIGGGGQKELRSSRFVDLCYIHWTIVFVGFIVWRILILISLPGVMTPKKFLSLKPSLVCQM